METHEGTASKFNQTSLPARSSPAFSVHYISIPVPQLLYVSHNFSTPINPALEMIINSFFTLKDQGFSFRDGKEMALTSTLVNNRKETTSTSTLLMVNGHATNMSSLLLQTKMAT